MPRTLMGSAFEESEQVRYAVLAIQRSAHKNQTEFTNFLSFVCSLFSGSVCARAYLQSLFCCTCRFRFRCFFPILFFFSFRALSYEFYSCMHFTVVCEFAIAQIELFSVFLCVHAAHSVALSCVALHKSS